MSLEKKILGTLSGIGGLNCPCCAPPPGKRREMFKLLRRRSKKFAIEEGIADIYLDEEEFLNSRPNNPNPTNN